MGFLRDFFRWKGREGGRGPTGVAGVDLRAETALASELVDNIGDVFGFRGAVGGLADGSALTGFENWRAEDHGDGGDEGQEGGGGEIHLGWLLVGFCGCVLGALSSGGDVLWLFG